MFLPALNCEDSKISQKPCDLQEWGGDADSTEEGRGGPARISANPGGGLDCANRPGELPFQAPHHLLVDLDS